MTSQNQHHSGIGDNVAGNKILYEVKSLAPADLAVPIEMVFESLRTKNSQTSKAQMRMLRAMAQRDPETVALVEVISIYGELIEDQDKEESWRAVAAITAKATNPIVKDVCLAALLKFSKGSDREETARKLFANEKQPGQYAREEYLRLYASEDELRLAGEVILPTEGELTGVVEGAIRLTLTDFLSSVARRLETLYPSNNASLLSAIAAAYELNPELERRHFWLSDPRVRERLDDLADVVVRLMESVQGEDRRVQHVACSIFNTYLGYAPTALHESLVKFRDKLDAGRSEAIASVKEQLGHDADLSEAHRKLKAAYADPIKRSAWCKNFLAGGLHRIENVHPFIRLGTPSELAEWLKRDRILDAGTRFEEEYVRLVARISQHYGHNVTALQKHELAATIDDFVNEWKKDLYELNPSSIVEAAEMLVALEMPDKALQLTTSLLPNGCLWPSPFVLVHLRCLLESEQYETFESTLERVQSKEESPSILNFNSLKAERLGKIDDAIVFSDRVLSIAPRSSYSWYRACYLRSRYLSVVDQSSFHQTIPDEILEKPVPEAMVMTRFITDAGDFKRVEPIWIRWFIEQPQQRAKDLVNFHFCGLREQNIDPSWSVAQCTGAFEYEQEGNYQVRLIVNETQQSGEYTLKSNSQLAELLQRLGEDETDTIGMVSYKLKARIPPYIGCLRIALRLRHIQNDGSDCFAMMQFPSDPTQMISFLEEKFAGEAEGRKQLETSESIPLYMRGHALYPSDALKGAANSWADTRIPKSPLWNLGDTHVDQVVLDAYGITYLASTDLAEKVLGTGVRFILPRATMEALDNFILETSDENFMQLGLTDNGRLIRTTAADLRERSAHILTALRLIRDQASIGHPVAYDAQLSVFGIRAGVDATVYSAMQLSIANRIPWFCMDNAFASLHHANNHPTANVEAIIFKAVASNPFEFERMRHCLLPYSIGALPIALGRRDLLCLAATANPLAGLILYLIIKNHGRQVFSGSDGGTFLLELTTMHLLTHASQVGNPFVLWPSYTPWQNYTGHVFNHAMRLYLALGEGTAERKLVDAMKAISAKMLSRDLFKSIALNRFIVFARGHFLNLKIIESYCMQRSI